MNVRPTLLLCAVGLQMYVCRRSTFSVSFCILFECKVNVLTYIVIDSNIHFIATLIVKNTNIVYYLTTLVGDLQRNYDDDLLF